MRISAKLIFITFLLSGCAKLEQDYPTRNFYAIDVTRKSDKSAITFNKTLEINRFNMSPKFSGREFLYRASDNKYVSDFYNQFFKAPGSLINIETYEWLTDSGIFKNVFNGIIPVVPDYLLDANITEIYVDLRKPENTSSILSIQFFITAETSGDSSLIFNKNYRQEVTVESRYSESFVKAWNEALEKILDNFEEDIAELNLN